MVKISQEFEKSVKIFRKILEFATIDVFDKNFDVKKIKYFLIVIFFGDIFAIYSFYSVIKNRDVEGMYKFGFMLGAGLKVLLE
jgi:hypothetical protein